MAGAVETSYLGMVLVCSESAAAAGARKVTRSVHRLLSPCTVERSIWSKSMLLGSRRRFLEASAVDAFAALVATSLEKGTTPERVAAREGTQVRVHSESAVRARFLRVRSGFYESSPSPTGQQARESESESESGRPADPGVRVQVGVRPASRPGSPSPASPSPSP